MKVLPSPQAISRMEETLTWNRFLEPDEAHLMWARAEGVPWKGICYRFGISRPTAHRRWEYALSVIAWRLNGRPAQQEAKQELRRVSGGTLTRGACQPTSVSHGAFP